MSFANSVCSYPNRGHYGNNKYRGNCTGHIIKDFIESYKTKKFGLIADPSIGGGTSVDVCNELGIRFKGTDLHQGFNLLRDDFSTFLGEKAHLVWWHPAYWNLISYSGEGCQWGDEPHKWDMSRMNMQDFIESLELSIMNIHDSVERGGHYGILMGNLRRAGNYYNLSSLVERIAPGKLVDEIIKIQHNCVSDSKEYSGQIIRIAHEKLMIFRNPGHDSLFFISKIDARASNMVNTTWKAAVRRVLQGGKVLPLAKIYDAMAPFAKHRNNDHWKAKIRQVLQDARFFNRIETGVFELAN